MTKHRSIVGVVGAITILMSLAATPTVARDTVIQLAPRIGLGRFHITDDHTIDRVDEQLDALVVGATAGVVTPIGVMFETGGLLYTNFSLFGAEDRFKLEQVTIALGYQFESDKGFLVTPKVGYAYGKLTEKEGQLGHPGPEIERREDGENFFWELTLQKRLGKLFALGVDLRGGSSEFGSARSISVIGTFDL